jgi:DNA-binding beta-propeller fold protein YncE
VYNPEHRSVTGVAAIPYSKIESAAKKGGSMKYYRFLFSAVILMALVTSLTHCSAGREEPTAADQPAEQPPEFKVDPFWPKPLPNNWLIGQVSGVAVDSRDHIWIIHRPGSLNPDEAGAAQTPPLSVCCIPAPPVIEFDAEGNVIQAWGGVGEGYDWPGSEHGIFVDKKDNVWIGGSGTNDHQVLKFSRDGSFLLQIGRAGKTGGSNDTELLGRPAEFDVDLEANEVYVADGYLNRRVIVFDADTGKYKRHWGAYGNKPNDNQLGPYDPSAPPADQFRTPVHSVRIANDGLVYVCDRVNCRIQIFQKDGTFVEEVFIARNTRGPGSSWDLDFSPDAGQTSVYVSDGTNQRVWILNRQDLQSREFFGRSGRNAGQFHWVHSLAVDSKGNLYTGEVETGKRLQKFTHTAIGVGPE